MKTGTHNLGRNDHGQLCLVRILADGVHLQVGGGAVVRLSHEQAQLLKEVL